MISVNIDELAPRGIRRRDALGLLDLVVMVEVVLMSENVDLAWTRGLADRLAESGLVPADASNGQLAAAVNDLNTAVRHLLGDGGDELPEPMTHVGIHSLAMPSQEAAQRCQEQLMAAGLTALVRNQQGGRWEVEVTGAELPPDPDFTALASRLEAFAAEHGGRYTGSGRR
jgi:hypothetical protein